MKSAAWFTACVTILVARLLADEKANSPALDLLFTVSQSVSKNNAGEMGLINGGILVKDGVKERMRKIIAAISKDSKAVRDFLHDGGK